MKRLSKDEIAAILTEHEKWLMNPQTGRQATFIECEFAGFNFPRHCMVSNCTVSGGTVSNCMVAGCKVSNCMVSNCTVSGGTVSNCTVSDCTVSDCMVAGCKVSGGTVSYCMVSGGTVSYCMVSDKPLAVLKGYSGLYDFNVWAVLFADGSRWIRMGCLFKSLEDWEKIGIRKSNLSQYPDDGSDACEERVRAFNFARETALALKAPHA